MNTGEPFSSIEIEIDSLVLNGFRASDRYRIGAAFESELNRLIREEGLPAGGPGGLDLSRLDAGSVQIPAGTPTAKIGFNLARSIYQRITAAMKGSQHD